MPVIDIAIDLGSSNSSIYIDGKGIVLKEPSVVMVKDNLLYAIGERAYKQIGYEPEDVQTFFPIKNGIIDDNILCNKMLNNFVSKVIDTEKINTNALFAVPCGITEQEREQFKTTAYSVGLSNVNIIPMVSAIYCLDNNINKTNIIIDCGAGYTDIALIRNGVIENGYTYNIGGNDFDSKISNMIKNQYGLVIANIQAKTLKEENSSLLENSKLDKFINGLDVDSNEPVRELIKATDIGSVLLDYFNFLNTLIKDIYNEASSKQQKELEKDGVIFSGGLAQIDGLDKYFENKLDLPVKILKNESNIYGLGNLIENKELLKRIMELN